MPGGARDPLKKKDGWSSSGKLIVLNKTKAFSMQADFPLADVYTMQFAATSPPSGVYRAVALVTWTVEGNQIQRMIDVANGAALSAPSQAARVQINDATTPGLGGTPGEEYSVSVSITRGTRAYSAVPPTLRALNPNGSVQSFTIAPLGTADFFTTPGSGVNSVEVAAAVQTAGQTPDLLIGQANGAAFLKVYKYGDQGAGAGFVPVAPQVTLVRLVNLSNANSVEVAVTWGIEG